MGDYEPLHSQQGYSWWRICILAGVYIITTALAYLTWSAAYDNQLHFRPQLTNISKTWVERIHWYARNVYDYATISHDFRLVKNQTAQSKIKSTAFGNDLSQNLGRLVDEAAYADTKPHIVCYYSSSEEYVDLHFLDIPPDLCTHINIGFVGLLNSSIVLSPSIEKILKEDVPRMHSKNEQLKILLSVGGEGSGRLFSLMVKSHATRKEFLQSVKKILIKYNLNGIDLDWEFPSAYNKERQHFTQLLYEIRQEFQREQKGYLLTVAVAAPEGIALFAYDVAEINKYVDYVSLMTYDFHFYSEATPFTGLNAPLFARSNELSIMRTLNINYSINWWLTNGLDRNKLVVGLPTYGHSFTLVNPFNNIIGAPAKDVGGSGSMGFISYSELCWFINHNIKVVIKFDEQTCSPYLSSGTEWISFENERSIGCKTQFIKSNRLRGVMIFSLNTDDVNNFCQFRKDSYYAGPFPLTKTVSRILLNRNSR